MDTAYGLSGEVWTASLFLEIDRHAFAETWQLVDRDAVAHAAPTPDHGATSSGLTAVLAHRLRGLPDGGRAWRRTKTPATAPSAYP